MVKDRRPPSEEHELLNYSGLQNTQNLNGETVITANKHLFNEPPEGRDNPGFEDNVLSHPHGAKTVPPFSPTPSENQPTADVVFQTPKQALPGKGELVTLVPTHAAPKNNQNNGMNGDGADYPGEIFISVNTHRKFIRGEKLYLTRDLRRTPKLPWRRIFLCGVIWLIIAAIVLIAALITTGILLSKSVPPAGISESYTGNRTNISKNISKHPLGTDSGDLFTTSSIRYPPTNFQSEVSAEEGRKNSTEDAGPSTAIHVAFSIKKTNTIPPTTAQTDSVNDSIDNSTLVLTRPTNYGRAVGDLDTEGNFSTSSEGSIYVTLLNNTETSSSLYNRLTGRQVFATTMIPQTNETTLFDSLDITENNVQGKSSIMQVSTSTAQPSEFTVIPNTTVLKSSLPSSEPFPAILNNYSSASEPSSLSTENFTTMFSTTGIVTEAPSSVSPTPLTLLPITSDVASETSPTVPNEYFSIIFNATNDEPKDSSTSQIEPLTVFINITGIEAEISTSPSESLPTITSSSSTDTEAAMPLATVLQAEMSSHTPSDLFSTILNTTDTVPDTSPSLSNDSSPVILKTVNTEPDASSSPQDDSFSSIGNISSFAPEESNPSNDTAQVIFTTNSTDPDASNMPTDFSPAIFSTTSVELEATSPSTDSSPEFLNTTSFTQETSTSEPNESASITLTMSSLAPDISSSSPNQSSPTILNSVSVSSEYDASSSLPNNSSEIILITTSVEPEASSLSSLNDTFLETNTVSMEPEVSNPPNHSSLEILNTVSFASEVSSTSPNDSSTEIINTDGFAPEASSSSPNEFSPAILNSVSFSPEYDASSSFPNIASEVILNTASDYPKSSSSVPQNYPSPEMNTVSIEPEMSNPLNYSFPEMLNTVSFISEVSSTSPNDSYAEIVHIDDFAPEGPSRQPNDSREILHTVSFASEPSSPQKDFSPDFPNSISLATDASERPSIDSSTESLNSDSFSPDESSSEPNNSLSESFNTVSVAPESSSIANDYSPENYYTASVAPVVSSPTNNPSKIILTGMSNGSERSSNSPDESFLVILNTVSSAPQIASNPPNDSSQEIIDTSSTEPDASPSSNKTSLVNTGSIKPEDLSNSLNVTSPVSFAPEASIPQHYPSEVIRNTANVELQTDESSPKIPNAGSFAAERSSPTIEYIPIILMTSNFSTEISPHSPTEPSSLNVNNIVVATEASLSSPSEVFSVIPNVVNIQSEVPSFSQTDTSELFLNISDIMPVTLKFSTNISPAILNNEAIVSQTPSPSTASSPEIPNIKGVIQETSPTLTRSSPTFLSSTDSSPLILKSEGIATEASSYAPRNSDPDDMSITGATSQATVAESLSKTITESSVIHNTASILLETLNTPTSSRWSTIMEIEERQRVMETSTEHMTVKAGNTAQPLELLPELTTNMSQTSNTPSDAETLTDMNNMVHFTNTQNSLHSLYKDSSQFQATAPVEKSNELSNVTVSSFTNVLVGNTSGDLANSEIQKNLINIYETTLNSVDVFVPSEKSSELHVTVSEIKVDAGVLKGYAENVTSQPQLTEVTANNTKPLLLSDGVTQDTGTTYTIQNAPRENVTTSKAIITTFPATVAGGLETSTAETRAHPAEEFWFSVPAEGDDKSSPVTTYKSVEEPSTTKKYFTEYSVGTESLLLAKDAVVTENTDFTSLPIFSNNSSHVDQNIHQVEQNSANEQLIQITTTSQVTLPLTDNSAVQESQVHTIASLLTLTENVNKNDSIEQRLVVTEEAQQSSTATNRINISSTTFNYSSLTNNLNKTRTDDAPNEEITKTTGLPTLVLHSSTDGSYKTSTAYSLIVTTESETDEAFDEEDVEDDFSNSQKKVPEVQELENGLLSGT